MPKGIVTIAKIKSKSGERGGKPWTHVTVTGTDGTSYGYFKADLEYDGLILEGKTVELTWNEDPSKDGKTTWRIITDVNIVSEEEKQAHVQAQVQAASTITLLEARKEAALRLAPPYSQLAQAGNFKIDDYIKDVDKLADFYMSSNVTEEPKSRFALSKTPEAVIEEDKVDQLVIGIAEKILKDSNMDNIKKYIDGIAKKNYDGLTFKKLNLEAKKEFGRGLRATLEARDAAEKEAPPF